MSDVADAARAMRLFASPSIAAIHNVLTSGMLDVTGSAMLMSLPSYPLLPIHY
jgi:hypothetical protein